MRSLIEFFIRYSVPTNIIIIGFLVFGLVGISKMKSSFFPLIPDRFLSVNVSYPGASPEEMEEGIVQRIEENLKGIQGIERVTSVSSESSANIRIELLRGYDANQALLDVKNAVDAVTSYPAMMENPIVAKINEMRSTVSFAVTGKEIPLKTLKATAREIEGDLLALSGISQVELRGFPDEEIEIAVKEEKLRAYNLTFQQLSNAIASTNIIVTGGMIRTEEEDYSIRAKNRNYYADELDYIVVSANQNGDLIRLRDVAEVRGRFSESPDKSEVNGELSVVVDVSNTNSEDMIATADQVLEYVEAFNDSHENLELVILRNSSTVLKQRTALLVKNAWQGMLLVLFFLAVFLNPRLAFWVAIGLPVSFLGYFMLADYAGVTINVISLFGLIIVLGILVDDGIVISENIYNHYEKGKSRTQAAIEGTMEVLPSIISAILTTIVAFCAFFFIDGNLGYFFSEIAIVVMITLGISLIEALLILPAHLAHSKAMAKGRKKYKINVWGDHIMDFMREKLYAPSLKFFLTYRTFGFCLIMLTLVTTLFFIFNVKIIKTTFFPNMASDIASVSLRMPQGTSQNVTDSILNKLEEGAYKVGEAFREVQEDGRNPIRFIETRLGPGTSNASIRIFLLEGEERSFEAGVFANALRDTIGFVYGVEQLSFRSGGRFGGLPISASFESSNVGELKAAKEELKEFMQKDPRLADVQDDDPAGVKEIRLTLKPAAYMLGFTLNGLMSQVRAGFFGVQAQRLQRGRDEIRVWVRYDLQDRNSIANLDEMWITTPMGTKVALGEIADYTIQRGEVAINHLDGRRMITISSEVGNTTETESEIMESLKSTIIAQILAKYPSVRVSYEGQSREANKVMNSAFSVLTIILSVIFFIIAFAFRTYTKQFLFLPIIILSLVGVAWGHYLHGKPINIFSALGVIALVGILVNDGLVLLAKFNQNIKDGMGFDEAVFNAGKARFRAIFLTTVTTVAGLTPLLFEKSRQAQFLKPMAMSIIYGIMFATILTLVLLPLLLSYHNTLKRVLHWLLKGSWPTKEEVERAWTEKEEEAVVLYQKESDE